MKIVSTVPASRFEKYGVAWPSEWDISYVDFPYTDNELICALKDADVLFVNSIHPVTAAVIQQCHGLRMIHTEGVSFDKVDVAAAQKAGIPVCNNRAVNAEAVAEHCIGLMLAGLRHTARVDHQIKTSGYADAKAQCTSEGIRELAGQEIGLIGMGVIGREVVKRLIPWGCTLRYKMAMGEVVIHPREAQTVQEIFQRYLSGASFGDIADWLQSNGPAYDAGKTWNKNMVARILEDSRYTGTERFQAILTASEFKQASARRAERKPATQGTEVQKVLRRLCNGRPSKAVTEQVLTLLNRLAAQPKQIVPQPQSVDRGRLAEAERRFADSPPHGSRCRSHGVGRYCHL